MAKHSATLSGRYTRKADSGFSLLELAVVLVIVAVITAMAMSSGVAVVDASRNNATQQRIKSLEQALLAYRANYNRLPCPASLAIAEGATNFGVEAATPGTCTGGTPAANSSAAGVTNTTKTAVEGAIPVVTLGLPNEMMYDGWGRRFRYAVDTSLTATGAFNAVNISCTNLAITVKDANGGNRSTGSAYAIISHGENGHGGYTKTGTVSNGGSTNTDELVDCHCDSAAAATAYSPVYVQKANTLNAAAALDSFDDIVVYHERWQVAVDWEDEPASCGQQYIYVSDWGNHRVSKFDLAGNFLMGIGAGYNAVAGSVGSSGSGNGQLYSPCGVLVDSSGNIYVGDSYNFRVQKFDSDGNFLLAFGTGYNGVGGSIGSAGTGNGQFDFGGRCVGLAFDASGNIWVTDWYNTRVQRFDTSGNYIDQFPTGNGADSILVNSTNIFTFENGNGQCSLKKRDLSGVYITGSPGCGSGNGQFYDSTSDSDYMTFDNSGNIWVSDDSQGRVQQFDTNINYLAQVANSNAVGADATGVAIDAEGNVYISDEQYHRISKYTSAGVAVNSYGGGTVNYFGESGNANDQFAYPNQVYISNYR